MSPDAALPARGMVHQTEVTGEPVPLSAATSSQAAPSTAASLEHGHRSPEAPPVQALAFTPSASVQHVQLNPSPPGQGMPLAELQPRAVPQANRAIALESSMAPAPRVDLAPRAGADAGTLQQPMGIDRSPSRQEPGGTSHAAAREAVFLWSVAPPRPVGAVFPDAPIARARSLPLSNPVQLARVGVAARAERPHLRGDDALPWSNGDAGAAVTSGAQTQTLARRSESAVDGVSPDVRSGAARAVDRTIDMPLVRQGAPASAGSGFFPHVARVADPRMARPDAVDAWSPELAGPPSPGPTTVHQAQPEQRGAHPEVDVDDIVERAWGALMSRLATEHERRGFARWA
jgi:hypothetical protein